MELPERGSEIYVPDVCYCFIDHPEAHVDGGLAEVNEILPESNFVRVRELPGHAFNWPLLSQKQEELKQKFGTKRATPNLQSGH